MQVMVVFFQIPILQNKFAIKKHLFLPKFCILAKHNKILSIAVLSKAIRWHSKNK